MTDKEIFLSKEFIRYATNLADFILRNHKLYALKVIYDEDPAAPVAYTDGKNIVLNVGNDIARLPKLLERRFKVNMGILFHEVAHKLFLDFNFNRKADKLISSGKLVGNFPTDPVYQDRIQEIKDAVSKPCYAPTIAGIYHHIANIINDGHDEAAMKRCFPGFVSECITVAGEVQMEASTSLHDMCEKNVDAYSIYSSLLLQYAKFGYYKEGDRTPFTEAYLTAMQEVEPVIETALITDDYKERWDHINSLMVFLWPVLKKHFPENPPESNSPGGQSGTMSGSGGQGGGSSGSGGQSSGSGQIGPGQGGSSSGGGNDSDSSSSDEEISQQIQQVLNALQKAAEESMNMAPEPVNCSGSSVSEQDIQSSPPSDNGGMSAMLQEITEEAARKSVQQELDKAQMEAIRNCNMPLIHKSVIKHINQHIPPNKVVYEEIAREIDGISRNLIREMLAMFRELNEEYLQRHKRFGPIIEATEAYRPQRDFFAKKKLPDDYPDMAICLLIDQSGSMCGEKLKCAQKTAILLERFARGIGVPILIAGHSTDEGVVLNIFSDFTSTQQSESRYSLGSMETIGCNRDGYAVRACAELLAKRPERVKLMISISDGSPNDDGYRGKEAREDIQQAVRDYRRKGLLVYGAAIDDDKEIIEEIYGKGFLSIENLALLPKTLVRLVRQQIV